jgi:type VI secretion system protein ImpE
MSTVAEQALQAGDPKAALKALQDAVRARPADARLRVFLFQLLCVDGQWSRALNQLDVCAEMDPAAIAMREMYGSAIGCEVLRAEVFDGKRSPMLFGEPEGWIALLIESLLRAGRGDAAQAGALRDQAFEQAPATSGSLNDQPFEWIADADMRLGPVLEAVVNGRYYWIPFSRLARVDIEEAADLRDYVWTPAHLEFANGGETLAIIPTRYPGSESSDEGLVALGRKTIWDEVAEGQYVGRGQRILTTDSGDVPLLDVRSIVLTPSAG